MYRIKFLMQTQNPRKSVFAIAITFLHYNYNQTEQLWYKPTGFKRKEFRGRLAIGITANFVNFKTSEEAEVEERSGVAFIFDQKFFLDLRAETGIDLENIVYYKDDTHYFVMTAKRQSLIEKGVIRQDNTDAAQLLAKGNCSLLSFSLPEISMRISMENLKKFQ